ncbi:oxidoreductase, FAD/FMN dependent [Bacteriovorax sp. BSW11_IV]|uniref:NADH:flavin oxidoreductase/NADH oxidase family protein n=1 Tax=Bacteriovorax sp. BSW11_IV TaxID=1353529 RepID=UPI00038A097B|nr:NADH:flavin oxidoreductase/NADH oxidase family protein [Bacteriovorax sp. BSW11_IV]EQC45054.1 oxidoreductase, FAD/FMN dependent [Bacteriovorax sp. BSW11_IV]
MKLFENLILPNGSIIPNRIGKAAMEENLADSNHLPADELFKLYDSWAKGGAGLIITGNVMIDRRAMTGPAGVVLEDDKYLDSFKKWAEIIKSNGAQAWMQINHPGRQMPVNMGQPTIAPSAISIQLGAASKAFGVPREMTIEEIEEVIERFVNTATLAEKAGFTGVEIHAAHGYLISQFLSPLTNKRTDQWGGSAENRSRFLFEVVERVRSKVSKSFAVAVKLNSADFQRGGFSPEDAKEVVKKLNDLEVDLVEVSGGSYEAPAMMGKARDERSLAREAYFLEFAKEIAAVAKMPIMVTGGVRRKEVAENVVSSGVDVVGIATALAINPSIPNDWKLGNSKDNTPSLRPITWSNKALASMANMAMVKYQFNRMIKGKKTVPNISPLKAFIIDRMNAYRNTKLYKKWLVQKN